MRVRSFVRRDATTPMLDLSSVVIPETGTRDGLGDRLVGFDRSGGETLQILRVRPELAAFGSVLDEVVEPHARVSDRHLLQPRGVARPDGPVRSLVVSEHLEGSRLSDLLIRAHALTVVPDITVALHIAHQTLAALVALDHTFRVAHGALSLARVIVTPRGRLVVAEHMFGPLLQQLEFSHARLWRELHIAMPDDPVPAVCDHRADVAQVAVMTLELILGRPLTREEVPERLENLLNEVREVAWIRGGDGLSDAVGSWLESTLPLPGRPVHDHALHASEALEHSLPADTGYLGTRAELTAFLRQLANAEEAGAGVARPADTSETDGVTVTIPGSWNREPDSSPKRDEVAEQTAEAAPPELDPLTLLIEEEPGISIDEDGTPVIELSPDILENLQEFGIQLPEIRASRNRILDDVEDEATPDDAGAPPVPEPAATPQAGPTEPPTAEVIAETSAIFDRMLASMGWGGSSEPVARTAAVEPASSDEALPSEREPQPSVEALEPEPAANVMVADPAHPPSPPAQPEVTSGGEGEAAAEPPRGRRRKRKKRRKDRERVDGPDAGPKTPDLAPAPAQTAVSPEPASVEPVVSEAVEPAASETVEPMAGDALEIQAAEPVAAAPAPSRLIPEDQLASIREWLEESDRGPQAAAVAAEPEAEPVRPTPPASDQEWPDFVVRPPAPPEPTVAPAPVAAVTPPSPPPVHRPGSLADATFPFEADLRESAGLERGERDDQEALNARVRTYVDQSLTRKEEPRPVREVRIFDTQEETPHSRFRWIRMAAAILLLCGAAVAAGTQWLGARTRPGTVVVQSAPVECQVAVDGAVAGTTPLTLKLSPGRHTLELRQNDQTQTLDLTVVAGEQLTRTVEWSDIEPTGALTVTSEPAGARVLIDGRPVGVTPVTVPGLRVGRHAVTVEGPAGSVANSVRVRENQTVSLEVPIFSGWLAVFAPVELQILENGRVLGTTAESRIMVPPGTHELELVNETFGYRAAETVLVKPGEVKALSYEPKGAVNLNAVPWAEVFVDGERVGETPLANVPVTIGTREFVFRHPELGERRVVATVTIGPVIRVNADLTRQ